VTYYLLHSGQGSAERLSRKVPRVVAVRDLSLVGANDIVIRYGNVREPDAGWWTMNRLQSVQIVGNAVQMYKMLRCAGVSTPRPSRDNRSVATGRTQLSRHYRVPVFALKALACFRTEGKTVWLHQRVSQVKDTFTEVPIDFDEQARKVSLFAVRVVHALGLECGLVSIGINPQGRPLALDVAHSPVLRGRMLELYALGLNEYIDHQEKQKADSPNDSQLLLGADLEFMFKTKQNKMMLASRFFSSKGMVGCDALTFAGDHAKRPLAEVRPEPARTPEEVCRNIEAALMLATTLAKQPMPKWVAGNAPFERYPIGGHIHFSGIPYTGRLVQILDVYVGLPMMLIEDPITAARRRPRYGFLGDIRHKGYGGFEYRTPASFLVDPDIALGALALAYVVALHHMTLPYLPLHSPENARAFYKNNRDHLLSMTLEAREHLSRTATFTRYRDIIEPIFDMIVRDEVWDEDVDVRTAWGLPTEEAPVKKKRRGQHRAS